MATLQRIAVSVEMTAWAKEFKFVWSGGSRKVFVFIDPTDAPIDFFEIPEGRNWDADTLRFWVADWILGYEYKRDVDADNGIVR